MAAAAVESDQECSVVATFPDPNWPGTSRTVFSGKFDFDNGVYKTAADFTGPVVNALSLEEIRKSIGDRADRGLAHWRERANRLSMAILRPRASRRFAPCGPGGSCVPGDVRGPIRRGRDVARTRARAEQDAGRPPIDRAQRALLGIVALRRGEVDNCIACVGPSSCIFPIAPEAVHTSSRPARARRSGTSRRTSSEWPGDLRVRWLLNLAYMTLGEYPEKVPRAYLIPLDRSARSSTWAGSTNVATPRRPDRPGAEHGRRERSSTTSRATACPTSSPRRSTPTAARRFFVNRGDGTFEDRSGAAGLDDQVYALNVTRADYDNDGDLDVLLLRGGWESPMRLSLLRNKGDGSFEDVTVAAGLGEPIATESAAWGDYDNDGLVDLFVCGEYYPPTALASRRPDPRNRCRLYRNNGDGTFVDVAATAGRHATTGAPRGRPGATTTTTAGSTCSSRT